MKKTLLHLASVSNNVGKTRQDKQHLLQQRTDLSVRIHTMEHNKYLNPPLWQIESLKKTLKEIEYQIHHYTVHKTKKT